ncbi:MAG: type II toxin-antitoxin system VapC family toxin [Candidatus Polarisedimenticolaceae bacterium]|nr:type II toxin-antitoxin system VapC family toxin [Candidatus Polarisedimenticolaceae bacterium]
MLAVDTNVLIRALVDDPGQPAQVEAAKALIKKAGEVFIPQIVQVETVWVLEAVYSLKRNDIVRVIDTMALNSAYHIEHEHLFVNALAMFRKNKADFADYLILAAAQNEDIALATFDKRLSKSPGVKLIETG